MSKNFKESIPETLSGLSIFLEECKKEINRISKIEKMALISYKEKSGNEYEYKKRGEL